MDPREFQLLFFSFLKRYDSIFSLYKWLRPLLWNLHAKKHKLRSDTINSKKNSPSPPDPGRFYRMSEVPSWVEDAGAECLLHTTEVLCGQMELRKQVRLEDLTNSIPSVVSATAACTTAYSTDTTTVERVASRRWFNACG